MLAVAYLYILHIPQHVQQLLQALSFEQVCTDTSADWHFPVSVSVSISFSFSISISRGQQQDVLCMCNGPQCFCDRSAPHKTAASCLVTRLCHATGAVGQQLWSTLSAGLLKKQ